MIMEDKEKIEEVKDIIKRLDSCELDSFAVPKEYRKNKKIASFERKKGLREDLDRGYDIIHNQFVVVGKLYYLTDEGDRRFKIRTDYFDTFEEYFDFLEGKIYDNACYKYLDFSKYEGFIKKNKIDVKKLSCVDHLIDYTIDDVFFDINQDELDTFDEVEKHKKKIKRWIIKFNECNSGEELRFILDKYRKSKDYDHDEIFFLFNYIYYDVNDETRFNAVMEYMSTGCYPEYRMIKPLCIIYSPDKVLEKYDYSLGSKQTINKHKKELRQFIEELKCGKVNFETVCYFDDNTHFFVEETRGSFKDGRYLNLRSYRYYDTFEEFAMYRNNDLRGVDLSRNIKLDVDFSKYSIDGNTRIPISSSYNCTYGIKKGFSGGEFYATKSLNSISGSCIKKKTFSTPFWFDYIYYLKGDISGADFTNCDGIINLQDLNGLISDGIKLRSSACKKFGIPYDKYILSKWSFTTFLETENNEEESSIVLKEMDEKGLSINSHDSLNLLDEDVYMFHTYRVSYITDLHLEFRLKNANCDSIEDVLVVLKKIVDNISSESSRILLIGGDVASNIKLFELFVNLLKEKINNTSKIVIFILGNHELWEFPGESVESISDRYREIVNQSGMYLKHNSMICLDSNNNVYEIKKDDLVNKTEKEVKDLTRSNRLNVFGGIGFAKYNNFFNANRGIYRDALNRNDEIYESEKYERLYRKIVNVTLNNTIILSHFPRTDWDSEKDAVRNYFYVSGHTHRNEFYDDGVYREYCDNQIGYHKDNIHLKNFLVDGQYDCFVDYEDGIYKITREQYIDFHRGKNIRMSFDRPVTQIYMLKKNGYYCFLHKSYSSLSILNGGALKRLDNRDIKYYFDNMDAAISRIKKPLDKYTEYQNKIANEIKKIGGTGKIHGCIVDIDFYNHIYVNPMNAKITAYWAMDIINKIVYPDIISLLKEKCPELHQNYENLIDTSKTSLMNINKKTRLVPVGYLSTDIYTASREIKKMQKLDNNILSTWIEPIGNKNKKIKEVPIDIDKKV